MLLRCESLEPPMSQLGQIRPLRHVRVESVLPPTSDIVGAAGTAEKCQLQT